jgi:hypothetical protein
LASRIADSSGKCTHRRCDQDTFMGGDGYFDDGPDFRIGMEGLSTRAGGFSATFWMLWKVRL